jgi:two-component sensor histidine kinase
VIIQSALDRLTRALIVSIGIGSVLFSVLGVPGIIEQHNYLNPVFSFVMIAVFCGLPPVMALIAFTTPVRVLRILAGVHAVTSLIFLVLWVPLMTQPEGMAGGGLPWIVNTIAVASSLSAIALPFLGAWAYMVVVTAVSGVMRYLTFGAADPSQAIQDSIMIFLLSGFMMALIQLSLRAGSDQDAAAALEQSAAAASGQQAALERRRSRYNAATRDEVVLALETAIRNTPESRDRARETAVLTLRKLETGESMAPVTMTMPLDELDKNLRTAAVGAGISYAFSQGADDTELDVPIEVGDALVGALTEAMENSIRHGNHRGLRTTVRSVRATRLDRGIEIIIKDDGPGFNPSRVGVDRLGMRLNILERIAAQPGARASIDSVRGRGTTVTLEWNEAAQ